MDKLMKQNADQKYYFLAAVIPAGFKMDVEDAEDLETPWGTYSVAASNGSLQIVSRMSGGFDLLKDSKKIVSKAQDFADILKALEVIKNLEALN